MRDCGKREPRMPMMVIDHCHPEPPQPRDFTLLLQPAGVARRRTVEGPPASCRVFFHRPPAQNRGVLRPSFAAENPLRESKKLSGRLRRLRMTVLVSSSL